MAPAAPVSSMIEAGLLEADPLGFGVVTGQNGEAMVGGRARRDLFVIGTLCKPRRWESTAVPELRVQAAGVGRALFEHRAYCGTPVPRLDSHDLDEIAWAQPAPEPADSPPTDL
jgi:uncharacterized NAD(P)/FAD-binding protein YdhS